MTKALVDDYGSVLPKTHAQVEAIRSSDLYGGVGANEETREQAANELADQLHKRIQHGAKVMSQEQEKNYRHLEKVPFIFLYMYCCGRSGSCVRPMLTVLHDQWGMFFGVPFRRANDLNVDDNWFLSCMVPHVAKLNDLFTMLRFYDPALTSCFIDLSENVESCRGDDKLVDQFARGLALRPLYEHSVRVLGALPTNGSIVELMFSAEQTTHRPNESRQQTTQELQYQQNIVAPLRQERSAMAAESRNKGNHSTLAQVQKAGEQMLDVMQKYSTQRMKDVAGRRTFQGSLKRADDAQANAAVEMKMHEREKQAARKTPSKEAVRERQLKFCSESTKHEKELAIIEQVTDEDRRRAVAAEVKFKGQVGAGTILFDAKLKANDKRRFLPRVLPLAFGFALAVTDPRAVLWWLMPRTGPSSLKLKLRRYNQRKQAGTSWNRRSANGGSCHTRSASTADAPISF